MLVEVIFLLHGFHGEGFCGIHIAQRQVRLAGVTSERSNQISILLVT